MSLEANVKLVKDVMGAFLAGDLEPLLAALTDDAEIGAVIPEGTPISGHFQGREGFLRYFAALAEVMEILVVETTDYTGSETSVVILGHERARVKRTGAMLEIPAIGMLDLLEQQRALRAFCWHAFVVGDEIQDPLRSGEDVVVHRRGIVEVEDLRHIAGNEIAPERDLPAVRRRRACDQLEERRLPGPVAADEPHALAFEDRDARLVEHRLRAVPHDEISRTGDGKFRSFGHGVRKLVEDRVDTRRRKITHRA
jgi:ketosteroid isomerase-like protein